MALLLARSITPCAAVVVARRGAAGTRGFPVVLRTQCRPCERIPADAAAASASTSSGTAEHGTTAELEEVAAPVGDSPEATQATTEQQVTSHALPDLFGAEELLTELQDERAFGKRGEVWTLARIAVIGLVLLPPFQLVGLVDILATLAITAGIVFVGYGLMSLGRCFSPLPALRANHQLVTGGMFAYARHPMYGGLFMAALGLAVVTRSETRLALAALLWAVLEKTVRIEESMLAERYGTAWSEYCARVSSKFFPYVY